MPRSFYILSKILPLKNLLVSKSLTEIFIKFILNVLFLPVNEILYKRPSLY